MKRDQYEGMVQIQREKVLKQLAISLPGLSFDALKPTKHGQMYKIIMSSSFYSFWFYKDKHAYS